MNRTTLLKQLTHQAGEALKDVSLKKSHYKKDTSIVTQGDFLSEKIIVEGIKNHFPKDKILSGKTSEYLWVIDPIDGTRNYKRGRVYTCVSVALTLNRQILAGMIYAPFLNLTYLAEANKGSFVNDQPIHCSDMNDLLNASCSTDNAADPKIVRKNYQLLFKPKDIRLLYTTGSSALSICEIAEGKLDLYLHCQINPWDQAAALLIAQEAGAVYTNFKGEPVDFFSKEIVVANPKLHKKFIHAILNN